MAEQQIHPHKVTKPIQLLAAWLVGLILIDGMFLTAALQLPQEGWERATLIISAVACVPLFLIAIFILQTRFRAELQEDSYYSEYLSKKSESSVRLSQGQVLTNELRSIEEQIAAAKVKIIPLPEQKRFVEERQAAQLDWSPWRIALNEFHPRFIEIRNTLRESGIPLAEIFGTDAAPSSWVIAINEAMPLKHKVALLQVAIRYEFEGFQFWTPVPEAEETEDVYIGSYGTRRYAAITPSLALLLKNAEEADLVHYMRRHTGITLGVER